MAISDSLVPTDQRRPVSVLYGGANRFSRDTPAKLQRLAQRALDTWVASPDDLRTRLGLEGDDELLGGVHARLVNKLATEPLEDLRIDFEDGLGRLSGNELDALALACGAELAAVPAAHRPPHAGLRVCAVDANRRAIAVDTVQAFLSQYVEHGGEAPVIVTLPKVESADDVSAFLDELERVEAAVEPKAPCPLEVMIESPKGLMHKGRVILHRLVKAGRGRVTSVHLGAYDYAASVGVYGPAQQPEHPSVELARQLLVMAGSELGVHLSDGALHQLPLPVHRGEALTDAERRANDEAMNAGWRRHAALVLHARRMGIPQGWDLHPHQLISRYAATFLFFREGLDDLTKRLTALNADALHTARTGATWDDAASARGLVLQLVLGHLCGAISDEELAAASVGAVDDVD